MKKLSLILLFSLGALSAFAQQRITLDLQQTIALANDSSLEAFRTKNMYLAGYWEYRTYKANRLPDRKSTRLNSSHMPKSRMPSSA